MEYERLENEIKSLIELHAEGIYWDFKKQWHEKNSDLLHDIICMANSPANRDCYIIIGVEDGTYIPCGVENVNRKNQQNVIDLLRQKPKWAGGYIPEVYVRTITILDKDIDILIIKQSDNTPFYLLEEYRGDGSPLFKGVIYTRKGDTNTPKTSTADMLDTEILWKRRFGLLYNPSQRAKNYLKDVENWEMVDGDVDMDGISRFFYYYKPDPDYTVHYVNEEIQEDENTKKTSNINDEGIGYLYFYLFAFCNVSYHTDFSNKCEVRLYYKNVPLFCSHLEQIDEGRTKVIPPEFPVNDAYYIEDSFRFLMFEFVFAHWCRNYSSEAKEMLKRVVPIYHTQDEHDRFREYIRNRGFETYKMLGEKIEGEALERLKKTSIAQYKGYSIPGAAETIATELKENSNLVINFACLENKEYDLITESLRIGKMLVDWLKEWRDNPKE
jgi:hypothetical protein